LKIPRRISFVIISLLLCPMFVPPANALPQHTQESVQIISVQIVGDTAYEELMVNGTIQNLTLSISDPSPGDPYVSYQGSYAQSPEYIGNTPYTWFTGISNPPELYIHLQPLTAIDAPAAVETIAALVGVIAAIPSGGLVGLGAALVSSLLNVDYSTIYSADHASDNSFSMWIPIDWFNIGYMFELSHALYLATPRFWWLATIGAYAVANR
jgi:hypothetical protein